MPAAASGRGVQDGHVDGPRRHAMSAAATAPQTERRSSGPTVRARPGSMVSDAAGWYRLAETMGEEAGGGLGGRVGVGRRRTTNPR